MYDINDYDYILPKSLIAQVPVFERSCSRLLRIGRTENRISHHSFNEIEKFLNPSDVLVVNDTKVIPGRLIGKKKSGGKVEILVLNFGEYAGFLLSRPQTFKCMIKASRKPKLGTYLFFKGGLTGLVLNYNGGIYDVEFIDGKLLGKIMYDFGKIPLPPYINRNDNFGNTYDLFRYQTVYANKMGAIAAPTAGLHFTKEIINRLKVFGVKIVKITLHVGYGTFSSVKVNDIRKHKMHSEWFSMSEDTAAIINRSKSKGKRIVAVGTTSVRTLEFLAKKKGFVQKASGNCDLFIYPGYKFRIVNAIITNFHFPKSTLLMLVCAFSDRNKMLNAYRVALERKYRFLSYGDAMFID